MAKAASLLPNTIEQATKGTPVAMLMQVVPRENIEAFLAIELTKLASMINVDERLNLQAHQIPFISTQLIDLHKSESLADFKICFQRGATGRYNDKLLRLDIAVICDWMKKYLEEKYQVVESQLMAEKENPHDVKREAVGGPNPERNLLALLKAVVGDHQVPDSTSRDMNAYQRWKLFQNELRKAQNEFNKLKPESDMYRFDDDQGHYVHAATIEEAEEIYNKAKSQMK